MRSIDNAFYHSKAWKDLRNLYITQHPLCERCEQQGLVVAAYCVHHKIHLNADNVNDPSIALNVDNLESLCFDCHNKEHFGSKDERRWKFDENGKLVYLETAPY